MTFLKKLAPDWRTAISAVLIVLSFPPWDFAPLIWVALVPWFAALAHTKNWKEALTQGTWLSVFMTLGGFYWVAYALKEFGELPWSLSIFGLLIFSIFGQPQFLLFAPIHHLTERAHSIKNRATDAWTMVLWALALGFIYVGADWCLPKLFVDTLGHSLYRATMLRQVADIGGPLMLTFIVFFVNHTIWILYSRIRNRQEPSAWPALSLSSPQLLLCSIIVVAALFYGHKRETFIHKVISRPNKSIQIGVIQANIGDFDKLAAESGVKGAAERVLNTFFTLSDKALTLTPKPDILIWPETSYPSTFRTPETSGEFTRDQALERYVRERGVPLLFGGYDHSSGKDFNAFFFLNPLPVPGLPGEGDLQIYRKNVLLLFGEFIPGAELFPFIKKLFPQVGNFGRGAPSAILRIIPEISASSHVLANPIICYEALFPNYVLAAVRKGSQLILNITNDSWFGPYGEPYLHLALSTFRSIESRRPQLRSTNTGISALIMPDGEITNRSRIGTQEILNISTPVLPPVWTLMLEWGDWFGPFAFGLGLVLLVGIRLVEHKARRA